MDKLAQYRTYILQLLEQYKVYKTSYKEVDIQVIIDSEHDHYQLVHVGWNNKQRIHGCSLHIDIIEGKIWIQYNGTDRHVASELVELGILKEDIVLGFQTPYRRQFTEYAVA